MMPPRSSRWSAGRLSTAGGRAEASGPSKKLVCILLRVKEREEKRACAREREKKEREKKNESPPFLSKYYRANREVTGRERESKNNNLVFKTSSDARSLSLSSFFFCLWNDCFSGSFNKFRVKLRNGVFFFFFGRAGSGGGVGEREQRTKKGHEKKKEKYEKWGLPLGTGSFLFINSTGLRLTRLRLLPRRRARRGARPGKDLAQRSGRQRRGGLGALPPSAADRRVFVVGLHLVLLLAVAAPRLPLLRLLPLQARDVLPDHAGDRRRRLPSLHALDARPGPDLSVGQKRPDHPAPARVPGERLVELGRDLAQPVQPRVRDLREVVVLVVEAHVVGERVERAVVRVRLLARHEAVVLGDEVARHRVQPAAEERPGEEVGQRLDAPEVEHGGVEAQHEREAEQVRRVGLLRPDDERPQAVDREVGRDPRELGGEVGDGGLLERGREVDVPAVDALRSFFFFFFFFSRERERRRKVRKTSDGERKNGRTKNKNSLSLSLSLFSPGASGAPGGTCGTPSPSARPAGSSTRTTAPC